MGLCSNMQNVVLEFLRVGVHHLLTSTTIHWGGCKKLFIGVGARNYSLGWVQETTIHWGGYKKLFIGVGTRNYSLGWVQETIDWGGYKKLLIGVGTRNY